MWNHPKLLGKASQVLTMTAACLYDTEKAPERAARHFNDECSSQIENFAASFRKKLNPRQHGKFLEVVKD